MKPRYPKPPPGVIFPPTYLTKSQVARVVGLSAARVGILAKPGQALQSETWHGTEMIPMYLVMAFLEHKKEKSQPNIEEKGRDQE